MSLYDQIQESVKFLKTKIKSPPSIAIVLGSGLGALADKVEHPVRIPYSEIPHFPKKNIMGHKGELVIGTLNGKSVALMAGRFHCYQGFSAAQAAFPIYVLKFLGIHRLILTNAAGGLPNRGFTPGDLMLITDQVNEMGTSPLIGYEEDKRIGPLFVPKTHCYDKTMMDTIRASAKQEKVALKEGVYTGFMGPAFETKAEIKKASLYSDAVGMSTVPEAIVANQIGLPVAAISCITNVHGNENPSHQEVLETGKMASERFQRLIMRTLSAL